MSREWVTRQMQMQEGVCSEIDTWQKCDYSTELTYCQFFGSVSLKIRIVWYVVGGCLAAAYQPIGEGFSTDECSRFLRTKFPHLLLSGAPWYGKKYVRTEEFFRQIPTSVYAMLKKRNLVK